MEVDSDFAYNFEVAKAFRGIVKVDISSIEFTKERRLRNIDPKITSYLIGVFSKSPEPLHSTKCRPSHHLKASVTSSELDDLLRNSELSQVSLQNSVVTGDYPILNLVGRKLCCLHGQHRIDAAKKILCSDDWWWPVQLHCFDLDNPYRSIFIRRESEQFQHETKCSDGELYLKIRDCQACKAKDLEQDLWMQLTDSKAYALGRLLDHPYLSKALDNLLQNYPALGYGLELGNWRDALDTKCHENIYCCINHIATTWDGISLFNANIRRALDPHTARLLESRAPSVSRIDREFIITEMKNGSLFPGITDGNLRESILQSLLRLEVIIPTLKSFHENMKRIETGAKILKTQLLDKKVRGTTLYRALCSKRRPTAKFVVECSEGVFRNASVSDPELEASLLYTQAFISALRNFPFISKEGPRKDPNHKGIEGKIDPAYQFHFLKGAKSLGYETEKMIKGLERTMQPVKVVDPEPCLPLRVYGEGLDRRWGRPFTGAFQHFRTRLFLPNLCETRDEESLGPSAMFIQQDFIKAFFGLTVIQTVSEPPTISIQLAPLGSETAGLERSVAIISLSVGGLVGPASMQPHGNGIVGPVTLEESSWEEEIRLRAISPISAEPSKRSPGVSHCQHQASVWHEIRGSRDLASPESDSLGSTIASSITSQFPEIITSSEFSPGMEILSTSLMEAAVILDPSPDEDSAEQRLDLETEFETADINQRTTSFARGNGDRSNYTVEIGRSSLNVFYQDSAAKFACPDNSLQEDTVLNISNSRVHVGEKVTDSPRTITPGTISQEYEALATPVAYFEMCPVENRTESWRSFLCPDLHVGNETIRSPESLTPHTYLQEDEVLATPRPSIKTHLNDHRTESCRSFLCPDLHVGNETIRSPQSLTPHTYLQEDEVLATPRPSIETHLNDHRTESCRSFLCPDLHVGNETIRSPQSLTPHTYLQGDEVLATPRPSIETHLNDHRTESCRSFLWPDLHVGNETISSPQSLTPPTYLQEDEAPVIPRPSIETHLNDHCTESCRSFLCPDLHVGNETISSPQSLTPPTYLQDDEAPVIPRPSIETHPKDHRTESLRSFLYPDLATQDDTIPTPTAGRHVSEETIKHSQPAPNTLLQEDEGPVTPGLSIEMYPKDNRTESCWSFLYPDLATQDDTIPTPTAEIHVSEETIKYSQPAPNTPLQEDEALATPGLSIEMHPNDHRTESCRSFLCPEIPFEADEVFDTLAPGAEMQWDDHRTESCRSFLYPDVHSEKDLGKSCLSLPAQVHSPGRQVTLPERISGSKNVCASSPARPDNSLMSSWLSQVMPPEYKFEEYNGMLRLSKSTCDMEKYLQHRKGWTMMVTRDHMVELVRFENITARMNRRREGEAFVLIKPSYVEQFRRIHESKRAIEVDNESKFRYQESNKRIKLAKYRLNCTEK